MLPYQYALDVGSGQGIEAAITVAVGKRISLDWSTQDLVACQQT